MKKYIVSILALVCSVMVFGQQKAERDFNVLRGFSFGVGVPFECRDLPGAGISVNIGYDCTYPVNDHLSIGFYLTGGGGLWSEYKRFGDVDNEHLTLRLTAGLMMQIGDPADKPYLFGVAPCTGFGLYDMDMVLPLEVRFGKYITDRWYIMGEFTYHASLADETACIEPSIRVGYNFGKKIKVKKNKSASSDGLTL